MDKKKKAEYKEEPMFKINKDIEKVFKKNYQESLKIIFSDVSKKIVNLAHNNVK